MKKDAVLLQSKQAEIESKDDKIQALTYELAYLRRIRYGVKSETFSQLQADLFAETWDEDVAAVEAELEQLAEQQPVVTAEKPKRPRAGRQPLPAHLPRIDFRHEPDSCQCGQCGRELIKIREDVIEQLDVVPAVFTVHRHIRPQYACKNCETITAAPIPAAVINGGMAAVGLLVWVLISKYVDHLPLYRLEQIAARQQVVLSRSTLADWVVGGWAWHYSRWLTAWLGISCKATPCMLMRPRSHNWIRGGEKPKRPISGRIAAMIYNPGRVLLSSTIAMAEAVRIAASSLAPGKAI